MKPSSFTKALALLAAVALVASASVASAQLSSKDDIKCRGTVYKVAAKLNATTMKAFDGCVKAGVKAGQKGDPVPDCSTLALADTKNKVDKAVAKVTGAKGAVSGPKAKCDDSTDASVLAQHEICSAPISDDVAVGSFSGVADCLIALNERTITDLRNAILAPDFAGIAGADDPKGLGKCIGTIAKGATKLHSTVQKEQGKAQAGCDKKGDSKGAISCGGADNYEYTQGSADPKGKIFGAKGAIAKLEAGIDKACGGLSEGDVARIGSCANTLDGIKTCVANKVVANAEGLTASTFDEPGTCPSQVLVTVRGGAAGGAIVRPTELDVGWTGLGHNAQVVDGFDGIVNLSCTDNTCSDCTVTAACDTTLGNCRCSNDATQKCSTPFVQDTCGGGNTCQLLFGPPLALSSSNTPVCITNIIPNDFSGNANLKTGESTTPVDNVAKVHLGISLSQPCPTCDATGHCDGGLNDGGVCTVDAIHPTFGPVSYDCQPDPVKNVSGAGLNISLPLTNETTSSLPFGTTCTAFGFGAFSCACAVCTGDTTVACNSDADCSGVGGTCSSAGSGIGSQPNKCSSTICEDQGNGEGECDASGPDQGYCDGLVRASGTGLITCGTNADCDNTDCGSGVGVGLCGECSISERLPCFLDPIEATGTPGTEQSVLVSTFCSPPTTSSAVNGAAGSPGPGRAKLDFAFVGLCSNGDIWGPGGANCQ